MSVTLKDYADREILAIVEDLSDDDGWTTTEDFARQLGYDELRKVSTRLSWMKRYGWLTRDKKKGWKLTTTGRAFISGGNLPKSMETILSELPAGRRLLVVRSLSKRAHLSETESRHMLRREWMRNI